MNAQPISFTCQIVGTRWIEFTEDPTIMYRCFILEGKHFNTPLYIDEKVFPPYCRIGDTVELIYHNNPYPGPIEEKITIRRPFGRDAYNPKEGF